MNDNAASWGNGTNTRFASQNECDFLLYDCKTRTLSALELKSSGTGNFTFWREDFEKDGKKHTYMIKKNQILGLKNWSKYDMNCGFIFNLRNKDNRTFYVSIDEFLDYTSTIRKKSINLDDILKMQPIEIENKLIRTNYQYDIDSLLKKIHL